MKKIIATLLCIAMLTALCGCGGGGSVETTVPPTTIPAAAEVYAEAAAKLSELTGAELVCTLTEEMDLGADHFETESEYTVTLLGLGTDAFAASSRENLSSGTVMLITKEVFLDGTVYTKIGSELYKSELTAEEYLEDELPLMLLDASLYETIERNEDGTFTFTGASALEEWCDNPYADPETLTVTATAALDENGMPSKYTYLASYTQGAADVTLTVTMDVRVPTATEITAPKDADQYEAVEADENGLTMADIAAQLNLIEGYLSQTSAVSSVSTDMTVCQAGGFTDNTTITMALYGKGNDTIISFNTVNQNYDSTAGSGGYTLEETFKDGVFTTVENGGKPQTTPGITGKDVYEYAENELMYLFPVIEDIAGYTLSIVGDTALLEYDFTEDYGKSVESYNCQYYFNDPSLLRSLSSETVFVKNSGYIGIDLITGMPLSIGQTLEMTHTIDGHPYIFAVENQQALQLGSLDAYETITGEPLPPEEPEELAKPVFYKVTGAGGETMWLLGTIHVGDVRTTKLPQEIYDALSASDALALEFDSESYTNSLMEDEEALAAYQQAMFYLDGTTVKDHLEDSELYENTIKLMKATGNYNAQMSELIKPVFQESILSNYYLSNGYRLSGDYGVDSQLEDLAREQEKEILSVESGEFQMGMLAGLSEALQELLLKETVEHGQFAYNYGTQELFEMWCRGEEAELIEYLNEEEDDSELTEEEKALYEEYENALGGMRNEDMLTVAQDYLNSGKTVFYAVGLAHLLADDGLVNTLRDAGYTVELVSYAG